MCSIVFKMIELLSLATSKELVFPAAFIIIRQLKELFLASIATKEDHVTEGINFLTLLLLLHSFFAQAQINVNVYLDTHYDIHSHFDTIFFAGEQLNRL